ncbi:hypothetical protein SDC9_203469 [bioreactor metagenome]|uniref:Uncharacterized protein n=1 Tax=bioreactor metagenome TaxID=1076179 RepID=A0A645IWH6_9ZZZZ
MHNLFAGTVARVRYLDARLNRCGVCGKVFGDDVKSRVGQPVTERELHLFVRKGFKVAVTDIDAFPIVHELRVVQAASRVGKITKIRIGRMVGDAVGDRVRKFSRRIDIAFKQFTHNRKPHFARNAENYRGFNGRVFLKPPHFHDVRGVK